MVKRRCFQKEKLAPEASEEAEFLVAPMFSRIAHVAPAIKHSRSQELTTSNKYLKINFLILILSSNACWVI